MEYEHGNVNAERAAEHGCNDDVSVPDGVAFSVFVRAFLREHQKEGIYVYRDKIGRDDDPDQDYHTFRNMRETEVFMPAAGNFSFSVGNAVIFS